MCSDSLRGHEQQVMQDCQQMMGTGWWVLVITHITNLPVFPLSLSVCLYNQQSIRGQQGNMSRCCGVVELRLKLAEPLEFKVKLTPRIARRQNNRSA